MRCLVLKVKMDRGACCFGILLYRQWEVYIALTIYSDHINI